MLWVEIKRLFKTRAPVIGFVSLICSMLGALWVFKYNSEKTVLVSIISGLGCCLFFLLFILIPAIKSRGNSFPEVVDPTFNTHL